MNKDAKLLAEAYNKVISEGLSPKGIATIEKWVAELGTHKAAYKLISTAVQKKVGLSLEDLGDTSIVGDAVDGISDLLGDKSYEEAWNQAKDATIDILEDEGMGRGMLGESSKKGKWWCNGCNEYVPSEEVTYEETHDTRAGGCGEDCLPDKPSSVDESSDHGCDPLGNGKFKMVPSGDVVDAEERDKRLKHTKRDVKNDCFGMSWKEIEKKQGGKLKIESTKLAEAYGQVANKNGHRLTKPERTAIGKAFKAEGLDGNGRFGNPTKGVVALQRALDTVGFHLDTVYGDILRGEKGNRLLVFRKTGEKVSPLEEHPEVVNSRISFSWEMLGKDKNGDPTYEILCYPS